MNSTNTNNNEVKDFYLTDPESYVDPDWTNRESLTETEEVVSILPPESRLLQKYEVHFTSYEDIKIAIRDRIEATYSEFTPKAVCKELPDAFIVEGRMNYVIKPISSTIFSVSSYFPGAPCRYGCSYWNYMEMLHDELCEYLDIKYEEELDKYEELEDVHFIEPADHELVYTQMVYNFTSHEFVKDALKYAINCSYNQRTSDEPDIDDKDYITKEVPDSCILIRQFVNKPTIFKIYLYQPKNETYICPDFTPSNLIYYIEDYRDLNQSNKEREAYYEKQFEDYLRLNPVSSEADTSEADTSEADTSEADTSDDDECPPLGIATAENVARANEILSAYKNNDDIDTWVDKYIEENRIRSSEGNNLNVDEDIYVYDGIDIYE